MKNKKYSPEYKIKCVKEVLEDHKSQKEITRKYELKTDRTIRRWIRNYSAILIVQNAKEIACGRLYFC